MAQLGLSDGLDLGVERKREESLMAPGILAGAIRQDEALERSSLGGAGGVPDMQSSKIPDRHPRRVAE